MATHAHLPATAKSGFRLEPYAYDEARRLSTELGLSEPVAVTLVRRGYRTVPDAKAFLDADESHDPFLFESMEEVVSRLRSAIAQGDRITVHGDYDADGVCSTAILVGALRALGADCDWYIPDRLGDGYGLTAAGVKRLLARGTRLLVTADCGITCAHEVQLAKERGMDVIVTDHHQPGDELPGCPIVHPTVSGYPCGDLCATGVAYKISQALQPGTADADLDLVALGTVADLVPLVGENRALVRRGLEAARRGARPGLRALAAAARTELGELDEGDLAFRLAPRINASGRLYRADAGVELMLTHDEARAGEIAAELDRANSERRGTEREVLEAAEAARRELPAPFADAPGLVLSGEGWHPGVVGICASRMVERTGRPVLLISVDAEGRGRGSGRSVPGYDLLGGLEACAEHLERFGGHRAAAGLELRAERIPELREAFAEHVRGKLGDDPEPPVEAIDAVVGTDELGLTVANELDRLAPFGKGNPPVRLVVPAARIRDVRPMGDGERHSRFSLEGAGARARGVAFGVNGSLAALADRDGIDVSVRLELNRWNGAVEPRVVLGDVYSVERPETGVLGGEPDGAEWDERIRLAIEEPLEHEAVASAAGRRRSLVDRRGQSGVATVAAIASSAEPVLVLCCDAARRLALVRRAASPARFGGGAVAVAAGSGSDQETRRSLDDVLEGARGGVVLADWARLERDPAMAAPFRHVVLIDPPPLADFERFADEGRGFLHLAWGPAEVEFALRVWEAQWPARPGLGALYRRLREAADPTGEITSASARTILRGEAAHPRSPESAGRMLRVLCELDLTRFDAPVAGNAPGAAGGLSVVSSEGTDLARSAAFAAYRARCEEGRRYLSRRRQPT